MLHVLTTVLEKIGKSISNGIWNVQKYWFSKELWHFLSRYFLLKLSYTTKHVFVVPWQFLFLFVREPLAYAGGNCNFSFFMHTFSNPFQISQSAPPIFSKNLCPYYYPNKYLICSRIVFKRNWKYFESRCKKQVNPLENLWRILYSFMTSEESETHLKSFILQSQWPISLY